MRFGDPPVPAPYLNGKDQRRLLGMVMTLSLIVMAVVWASRPEAWHWLIPPDNELAQNDRKTAVNFDGQEQNSLAHETVTAKLNSASNSTTHSAGPTVLPRDWYDSANDNVIGIRAEEASDYYRILAHISRLDTELLARSSRKDVLHVNLIRDPEVFRGELIRVKGMARRLQLQVVDDNEFGVRQIYELWLTTDDAGSDPWRIVSTTVDSRLPTGDNIAVPVELHGYFFKQYSYASRGGLHVAPLILAAQVNPSISRKVVPSGTGLEPYILFFAGSIGLGTILASIMYSSGDRRFKARLKQQFPLDDNRSVSLLEELPLQTTEADIFS